MEVAMLFVRIFPRLVALFLSGLLATPAFATCYQVTAEGTEPILATLEFDSQLRVSAPGAPSSTVLPWIKSTLTIGGKTYSSAASGMIVSPTGGIFSSVVGGPGVGWSVALETLGKPWTVGNTLPESPPQMSQWEDAYVSIMRENDIKEAHKITSLGSCRTPGKIFFYIAYLNNEKDDKDCKDPYNRPCFQSFVDAAETWRRETISSPVFKPGADIFIQGDVRTADDFVDVWKYIFSEASRTGYPVQEGRLFTHTSYFIRSVNGETGLEFGDAPGSSGHLPRKTLTQDLIRGLPQLPWIKDSGRLVLLGCNTAEARGEHPWIPAKTFANTQQVITTGEVGWSSFSQSKDRYIRINRGARNIYLGAYVWGKNLYLAFPTAIDTKLAPTTFIPD
jgi:hypothetical protein